MHIEREAGALKNGLQIVWRLSALRLPRGIDLQPIGRVIRARLDPKLGQPQRDVTSRVRKAVEPNEVERLAKRQLPRS